MGTNQQCIFTQKACENERFMIMALYPPAASKPDREHDNETSREIAVVVGNMQFAWNNLFPYAPVQT
jgi:hypothetical protein